MNIKQPAGLNLVFLVRQIKEPKNDPSQLTLLETKEYEYFCYVTTEPLSPWAAHKKYGERATCETWIEEAKGQMGLAHLKTDDFLANSVLFQSAILAYNTLRWMALMSANKQLKQWEPETIRSGKSGWSATNRLSPTHSQSSPESSLS